MRPIRSLFILLFFAAPGLRADPQLSSWITAFSTKYARIYTTDASRLANTPASTWSNGRLTQALPAYCGVQEISYSANWIYIRANGLGSHTMGPWYNDATRTTAFVNLPVNQKEIFRIPRVPVVPATKVNVQGEIGWFVDSVHAFDSTDATSYSNANARDGDPPGSGLTGDGIWNRDAYQNEAITFDPALAHQQNTGVYHYHANPLAPRYLLGDHVDFDPVTKYFNESAGAPAAHSPIVGWAKDGFPIYGPYGYASAMSATSGLRRMIPGYVPRDGTNGTVNIATAGRHSLPAWAARVQNRSVTLTAAQYGPDVSPTFAMLRYIEDNDYLGDLGKTQGVNFDLDEYNGRLCVTPEFPGGTYAYFVAITSTGAPNYPYNVGKKYYGTPSGGIVASIAEPVTIVFKGGPDKQETMKSAAPAGNDVTLVWNSTEGGTYKVEASSDLTAAWSTLSTTKAADSNSVQSAYVETGGAAGRRFYRVTKTALAAYDSAATPPASSEGISSVAPITGARGATIALTITLNSAFNPPPPPASVQPTSVTLTRSGAATITATASTRNATSGIATSTFSLPAGAVLGAYTVNAVFGPNTWSLTNGFTVTN